MTPPFFHPSVAESGGSEGTILLIIFLPLSDRTIARGVFRVECDESHWKASHRRNRRCELFMPYKARQVF